MDAEKLIRTAAKGNNIVARDIVEAGKLQAEAVRLLFLDVAEDERAAAYNSKVALAAVYVAGKIRGKQEERERRRQRAKLHAAANGCPPAPQNPHRRGGAGNGWGTRQKSATTRTRFLANVSSIKE